MKNILITGGAGFIGSHVVRLFVNKYPEYKIVNLDKLTYAGNLANLKDIEDKPNYFFERADICDFDHMMELFAKYDIDGVIHLAAESHVDRSIKDPFTFARTNVMGTLSLLQAAKATWDAKPEKYEGKRFYHISTDEVYGALELTKPDGEPPYGDEFFLETTKYNPHSPYSASKASSDHFVRAFHDTYGLPTIVTNCSNNYGPYQFPEKLIPLFINNIRHSRPLPVYGKGENVRDWLYVVDHARAIDVIFHQGKIADTYNIGGFNEWKNIGLERSMYFDYYHMMTLDVEFIRWKVGSSTMEMKMVAGAAKGYADFSSMDFFKKQYYRELQGMDFEHPFQLIYDYYRMIGGQPFTTEDYVSFRNLPITQLRQEFIRLSFEGFVTYDDETDMIEPTEKLFNYLEYAAGKKDYDVIRFGSVTEGKEPNGILDLKNYDIQLNGVYEIQLGEDPNEMSYDKKKQAVAILPKDHKVILKRNRDFKFDGSVVAGLISLTGTGFYFSYDNYRIELNQIKEMGMKVRTGRLDGNGMPVVEPVNNTLSDLSGYLEIDEPNNKSWIKENPQYPRLTSTKDSYVYYDHPNIQRGKYTRDKFYYKVDPFVLENLKQIETDKTSFNGELISGMIFPPIRQPLVVRKHDNSLGFETKTNEEGLPAYNGRATYYSEIDLSNSGLRGTGEFHYIKSRSISDDILFLPEEAYGYTKDFYVDKVSDGGVVFPDVELGHNQEVMDKNGDNHYGETFLEFSAFRDQLAVSNTRGEFHMFKNTKSVLGFDCIHKGTIYVTPTGLSGLGTSDLPHGAKLESAKMDFTDHTIIADTSYFAQYRPNPKIPGAMMLQSDGLRQDILIGDTIIKENRNRKAFYAVTAGKHPEKRYYNDVLRENAIYKDMEEQDDDIGHLFASKSMIATIDFEKREGYFTYKNSSGGEKTYPSIEYKTWVKQFTWDMDRNIQVVGHKGVSPGLRFVSTKEKRDSLQFYVPYARFLGDEDVMYCEEVKYINTADAKVILDERGLVTLRTDGVMDPLEQSKVELKTDSTYHLLYDTKITIEGAKKYKGFGYYDFVNKKGEKFPVFMSEIGTDEDAVSITKGSVGEEVTFDDYFAYKGEMRIRNGRQLLEYNGGARMIHRMVLRDM